MIKISYILNILVAIVALGIMVMVILYGIRYFASSDDNVPSFERVIQKDEQPQSVINEVILEESVIESPDANSTVNLVELSKQSIETVKPKAPVAVTPPKVIISLYPTDSDDSPAFTTMERNSGIVVFEAADDWTEVFSSKGLPVWIRGDMVTEYRSGYVQVLVPSARTRNLPTTESSLVMGSIGKGEVLKVSRKKDGWYRVWSPIRFTAWVKTADLKR